MNVLVTGGAGFIGSHLVEALLRRGDRVTVLDRISRELPNNTQYFRDSERVRVITGDAADRRRMEPLVAEADLVFHLAAIVGVERVCLDPGTTLKANFAATETVCELCLRHQVKLVFASTSEVYGKTLERPVRENTDPVLGPTFVPRWSYAVSKLADEYLVRALMDEGSAVIVRFFNCYGPRLDPSGSTSVVSRFIGQALRNEPITVFGTGDQTRSFTYVSDTVTGTLAAADRIEGEAFNIGRPCETSINELAALIRELAGSTSPIEHREPPTDWGTFEEQARRLPDITKSAQELGFEPRIDLRTGLVKTIAWMSAQIDGETDLRETG